MEIIKLSDHILNENTCTVSWNETHQVHEKNIQSHAMRFIENWGPLVSLPGFHCSMIRFCWTHNVHLGLFQRSNASCLLLGWNWTNETAPPTWHALRIMKIKGLCHCAAHVIRLELHAGGFFGDPSTVQFEEAVQKAWCQFKQWKRTNKISCSQPSFKASHVDRLVYIHFSFCSTNMIWKCSEVIALKFYWDWTTCVWGCEPHPRGDYKRGSTLELEGL
jgi:hypothetical protein